LIGRSRLNVRKCVRRLPLGEKTQRGGEGKVAGIRRERGS